jgi:hypothetical protein
LCVDDSLWLDKISGDGMGYDEVLVISMARRGVVLYLARTKWEEQNANIEEPKSLGYYVLSVWSE